MNLIPFKMIAYTDKQLFIISPPSNRRFEEDGCGALHEVTQKSPFYQRKTVEQIARYFLRESDYDFLQFDAYDEDQYRAFLFLAETSDKYGKTMSAIGACCFRWREYTNAPHGWALQWIWLHPFFRGKGVLKWAWPSFVEKLGDFYVEGPFSPAMEMFLSKYATGLQKEALIMAGWVPPPHGGQE
jgi:GNAT superfamily N-acetyltransferase